MKVHTGTFAVAVFLSFTTSVVRADSDIASSAAEICGARNKKAVEEEHSATEAEAAKKISQVAYEQAAASSLQATKELATNKGSKEKQEDAKRAAQELASRQTDLAKAVQLAKDKAGALSTRSKLRAELCVIDWSRYSGRHFPLRFIQKLQPKVCEQTTALGDTEQVSTAQDLCNRSTQRSATGFGNVTVNLVLGLGDLLQAEAKQEVLEYLLNHVAKKFCQYRKADIELVKWFSHTCGKLFPNGFDGAVDAEAFNFGELKDAFNQDLKALPGKVGPVVYAWIKGKWDSADPYIAAGGALVLVAFDVSKHEKPGEILEHLGSTADSATEAVICDFTSPDAPEQRKNRKACAALLLFQLGRTGFQAYAKEETPHLSNIIEDSLVAFCKVHGASGKQDNGDCVIDPVLYEEWHNRLLEFWRAAKNMIDLQLSIEKVAKVALPGEVSKRAGPEIVRGLRELVTTFAAVLEGVSPADKDHIANDAALVVLGLDVYEAIVADDPAALRKGLIGLLESPIVSAKLSAKTARSITVVVSLGTAKDRTEVKDILADVVSPVGSYKAKYGADHVVVTLNGFVGFFAGGEYRTHVHSLAGKLIEPTTETAPFKLATPVGVDLTLTSSTKHHFGVFVSIIDPLSLQVSDDGGTLHAAWKTLFEPGFFVRMGLFRSPFSLALGVTYSLGRRSSDICGTDRCFDGAFQYGAFLSADVPLLPLR